MPKPQSVSFRNGLEQLSAALAAALPAEVLRLQTQVREIIPVEHGVQVEISQQTTPYTLAANVPPRLQQFVSHLASDHRVLHAKHVILSTPAEALAELLAPLDATLASALRQIPYAPLGLAALSIDKSASLHPLNGFGMLVPPARNIPLLGALFPSSLFPGRAPQGKHLITCFLGGACFPEQSTPTELLLERSIFPELKRFFGWKSNPSIIHTEYYPRAIPNYPVGHYELQNQVREFQHKHPNISLLSNAIEGIGLPDRIFHAQGLACRLLREQ